MDIFKILQEELQIGYKQVEAAVQLIDEGNTIPFIARYRKEATGSLNDEVLRNLDERLRYLRNLDEKKEQVLSTIRDQEKLTPELEKQIQAAMTMVALEDLYRPYRPKRRTRAMIAKERGLEPLADLILAQQAEEPLEKLAEGYVSEAREVLMPLPEQRISLRSAFPTRQITALISERLPQSRACSVPRPEMKRQSLFMRCITSTRNR